MTDQVLAQESTEVELPDDPTTEPFWRAALEGRLTVQHCASCGTHQFFPRPVCVECDARELTWVEATGHGTVYSLTTVTMRVADDLEPPYQVALVDLDEGVRMLAVVAEDFQSAGPGVDGTVHLVQRPGRLPRLVVAP